MVNSGGLGWSKIRLLPKRNGVRPIINLRRKQTPLRPGRSSTGSSINSLLTPVFSMLNYEKAHQSNKLRYAIFSVGELYDRLKAFRQRIGLPESKLKLYFAKVDVKSCFDTIPQAEILNAICALTSKDRYRINRYGEFKSIGRSPGILARQSKKFVNLATALGNNFENFATILDESAKYKKQIIYAKNNNEMVWQVKSLTRILDNHINKNLVRIGTKHYRQKRGIPQGSSLSPLLCSFFYGNFESQALEFLRDDETILLRLIDDFLLISLNKIHAERFLEVMFAGDARYGITVNPAKSLVNFPFSIQGADIPGIHQAEQFPYCSMLIDTNTLEMRKDRTRTSHNIGNTFTVEHNNAPGHSLTRKMLSALKIQMHAMLLDTSFNDWRVVMLTLYQNFLEVGMKLHRYIKCLPKSKKPRNGMIIATISEVLRLAFTLSQNKQSKVMADYRCTINVRQTFWLGASAFETVLRRKQAHYAGVLTWLRKLMFESRSSLHLEDREVELLVKKAVMAFSHCRY